MFIKLTRMAFNSKTNQYERIEGDTCFFNSEQISIIKRKDNESGTMVHMANQDWEMVSELPQEIVELIHWAEKSRGI